MKLTLDTHLGYLYFIDKDSYLATGAAGRVLYHRYVYSYCWNDILTSKDIIHHIDGDKLNNSISNLEKLTKSEHSKLHALNSGLTLLVEVTCPVCGSIFKQINSKSKFCSPECSSTYQIKDKSLTKELLDSLIPTNSWVVLGSMFGYSDNGIKKRAKALGCFIPKRKRN